jgi:hypothetical protein
MGHLLFASFLGLGIFYPTYLFGLFAEMGGVT